MHEHGKLEKNIPPEYFPVRGTGLVWGAPLQVKRPGRLSARLLPQAFRLNRFMATDSPSRTHVSAMSMERPMSSSSCRRSPSSKLDST